MMLQWNVEINQSVQMFHKFQEPGVDIGRHVLHEHKVPAGSSELIGDAVVVGVDETDVPKFLFDAP